MIQFKHKHDLYHVYKMNLKIKNVFNPADLQSLLIFSG